MNRARRKGSVRNQALIASRSVLVIQPSAMAPVAAMPSRIRAFRALAAPAPPSMSAAGVLRARPASTLMVSTMRSSPVPVLDASDRK